MNSAAKQKIRFLLAHLNLEALKGKLNAHEVRLAIEGLRALPEGNDALTTAYDRTWSRIDAQQEEHRKLAHLVLSWVIHAYRPLTIEALRHALTMARYSTVNPNTLLDPEYLTAFCAGLVTIDHADGTVRLAHFTIQTYFERVRRSRYPEADKLITETCLKYMDWVYGEKNEIIPTAPSEDFLGYSSEGWLYHAYEARAEDLDFLNLHKKGAMTRALEFIWGADMTHYFGGATLLMICAFFGFGKTLKKLLDGGADVDETSVKSHTALHYATIGRRPEIAKLLLDYGADVNAVSTKARTPLHYALNHKPMVRLLLDHGADLNMSNQHYDSTLHQILGDWREWENEWKEEWQQYLQNTKETGNSGKEQRLWMRGDTRFESAVDHILHKELISNEDAEENFWEIFNMVIGDSRADLDRLGTSLLEFVESNNFPKRVLYLIRSRITKGL